MTDQPTPHTREQLGLGASEYLRLTEDELALVLVAMKLPRIIGFEVPDDIAAGALQGAQNTLRARGGAVVQPDGTYVIDENIASIVGKGARWARLITIALKFEDGAVERHWIYMGRAPAVLHSIPEAGIHQFQTIPDGNSMLLTLAALLRMRLRNETLPNASAFKVSAEVIDEADRLRGEQGADAAYQYLLEANVPESFARTAVGPSINAVVSVMWATTGEPNAQGVVEFTERVAWVWGVPDEGGYWLLVLDRQSHTVSAIPANPAKVLDVISDFVVEDTAPAQ